MSIDKFKQSLSLFDGTMIVAGSMIGSGIFIVSADMMRHVGSAGWLIALWIITGLMTVFAAITYGELSSMFPKAGGQYVYLKEAYNPFTGFLYGWSFFSVIQTGTIAAVGVAFSKFAGYFIPALTLADENIIFQAGWFKLFPAQLVSIALIIFLTFVNTRGVKEGKLIQSVFTVAKLFSLFALIIFGFLLAAKAEIWNSNWTTGFDLKFTEPVRDAAGAQLGWSVFQEPSSWIVAIGLISSAMVGSVFSSVAWENVTFIAGEIKNPKRNVGLSLFLGTIIVTSVYLITNIMYVAVLPLFPEVASGAIPFATESATANITFPLQDRVATAASSNIFGVYGTAIIAIMIMVSTFGCNNGLILTGSRVFYTMAKDKLFLSQAGTLNKNAVPQWALWAQCSWASVLCLSGKYGLLLDYVVFITLVFYILTIIGVFRLRKSRPDVERPYKAFGYPVIPIIYILMAGTMAVGLLYAKPSTSLAGLGIVVLGIPLYFIAMKNKKNQE
ncbi:MAG TPA: amino acid permease [Niabella sp.]|nr:amino acid permease [Niabella sp.]HQW14958.1 amino acid permease [Niabella sp.]HQX20150.1 amino acid permease [Niabella sp.]HQX41906.1 amino acid permease [Niabella sp.]HRB06755.1 amino acid permease [Niabella sp.]